MDTMEVAEEVENETVELLLMGKERFRVNKATLKSTSRYFESLFTHNFSDSQLKECAINYNFAPHIVQNFVDWVAEEQLVGEYYDRRTTKKCMKRYRNGNNSDLLELLHFSVIFAVEQLQFDITAIILRFWRAAEDFIDLLLLSRKLGITELQNYAFASCVDRFSEIPNSRFNELPKEIVLQILCNKYLKNPCPEKMLEIIKNCRMEEKVPNVSVLREAGSDQKYLSCIVWYKKNECDSNEISIHTGRKLCIYAWNGQKFYELVDIENIMLPGKDVFGMQVIGKGYSIYLIGGERGLGSGHFNMNIWRYCLLSKQWYFTTRLPNPRRHMAVAFLGNNLLLVGGVGRCRVKLASVDIYNIYTDSWSTGENIPEEFTEVPPTFVANDDELLVLKSNLYTYSLKNNNWRSSSYSITSHRIESIFIPPYSPSDIYMGEVNESKTEKNIVYAKRKKSDMQLTGSQVVFAPISVTITDGIVTGFLCYNGEVSIYILNSDDTYSKIYSERRGDMHPSSDSSKLGCFTMYSPETLYPNISSLLKEVL